MATRNDPKSLEAETSALGCAFMNKNSLEKMCEELTSEMFYSDANAKIFSVLKELYTKNIPVDSTTVINELEKKKELNSIGGVEYITEIIDNAGSIYHLNEYIKIIYEKYILRNLINKSNEIIEEAYEEKEEVEDIIENAERSILSVHTDRLGKEIKSIQDILPEVQSEIEELAKSKTGVTGVPTGFHDLDKKIRGFSKNQIIIVAGRPGAGKSTFALNLGLNAAILAKKSVAFFSLEMRAEEIVKKMYSSIGRIDGNTIATGKLNNTDWKKFNEAQSELADTKFFIDDTSDISVNEIKRKCRRLKASDSGLDLIIIDYLQLINSSTKYAGNRVAEVSEVSRDLKKLAMELEVPVVALAQLSRSTEQRKGDDRKPRLSDLRDSGSIEQDADIVLFLYSEDYYENITNTTSKIELLIAKHRNGETGSVEFVFEKNISKFNNFAYQEEGKNE